MRQFSSITFAFMTVTALVAPGAGCTPDAGHGPKQPGAAACSSDAIEACEATLASALESGSNVGDALAAYAQARADKDPAVGKALSVLKNAKSDVVVVRLAGAKVTSKLTTVDLDAAPKPLAIPEAVVWLALAEASKIDFLVVARPDGSVARYFPHDALRPMMGGLTAAVIDDKCPDLDRDALIERAIRDASKAAKAFDYVAATHAIDRVDGALTGVEPFDAVTMRGQIFAIALALSKPTPADDGKPTPPNVDGPPPSDRDTPYLDLLRVRVDHHAVEWPRRKARLLAAFPADRRDAVRGLYDPTPACTFASPPPIERESDLLFAYLVSRSLLPAHTKAPLGRVSLDAWYPRYTALLDTVERTGNGWYEMQTLMFERGQSSGMVPSGSEVHKRATNLAIKHARALKILAAQEPGRVGVGQVGFLMAPGSLLDESLRKEVVDLADITARVGLNQAKEPTEVAMAAITGVLAGVSMPPALREAHFTALQSAFTAKLRGDLGNKTGWGIALLYALDGTYRAMFGQAPNLKSTAEQVSRALESDPKIAQPGLAALTAAMTRYVALATDQGLGSPIPEGKDLQPARAAARASLERAIAALGDGTPPPRELSKEVADLADETIATMAIAFAGDTKKADAGKKPDPKSASKLDKSCGDGPTWTPDPKTRRALEKLRDLRHKIVTDKAFTSGNDLWSQRARLVVVLLSDAIDVASDWSLPSPRFAISEADGARYIKVGLDGWVPFAGIGDTFAGSFTAYRGLETKGKDFFASADGATALRKVLAGIGLFFGSDSTGHIEGAELLTMLAPTHGDPGAQLVPVLVDVAKELYGQGKTKQADMLLLSTLVVSGIKKDPPAESAVKLAVDNHSRAAWVLEFDREISAGNRGEAMHVDKFVPDLKKAMSETCGIAGVDELASVLQGIDDFRSGKHKEGRAHLALLMTDAQKKAFSIPRVAFAFQQETKNRAMNLSVEFGLGSPLLSAANSFSVGAGAKSAGEPVLKLGVTVDSPDAKRALDDTARFYIVTSALDGVYAFLDGDTDAGEVAAARTLGVATQRTWLGVPGTTDDPLTWSADARTTIAILGELAAEKGRPLLAGELFSLVKASLGPAADKEKVKGVFDPLPLGLVGVKELAPVIERAKTTVAALTAGMTCIQTKDVTATYEKAQCDNYATALALRVADSVHVLPVLSAGPKGQAGSCSDLAALDGFLVPAQKQTYEPDKFLDAVTKLTDAGKYYDATVLMTKHRRPDHCSAAVTDKLSVLADHLKGAPNTRADLLSALVNCSTGAPPIEVAKTLTLLDDELLRVGDPMREAQLALFATSITLKTDSVEPLAAIALRPDFLDRWRKERPEIFVMALALDHGATILSGKPPRIDETARDFALLCSNNPSPERAQLCKILESLRVKNATPEARKKAAKDALGILANASDH